MANAIHVKVLPLDEDERQAEVDKTTRLRALRLAKEAAGSDATSRVTAAVIERRGSRRPLHRTSLRS
jgi:hypothetical protein